MKHKPLASYLFEDNPPAPDPTLHIGRPGDTTNSIMPQNISLDQRVDHYLMQYEKEASPTASKSSNLNKPLPPLPEGKVSKFMKLLFEADADAGGDAGGGAPAGGGLDLGGPPDTGGMPDLGGGDTSGGGNGEPPEMVPVPKLNLNIFANRAARLVMNYENLLDPKTIILNRILAYIGSNYSQNMANELRMIFEMNYNLSPKSTQQFDVMNAPIVPGAGVGDLSSNVGSGGSSS